MKQISVFGATGSIGQSTIDIIKKNSAEYKVVCLTGGQNIGQLVKDALDLKPDIVVSAYDDQLDYLKASLEGSGILVGAGRSALIEAAHRKCDIAVSAIIGAAGLEPGLAALENGADLALANKESMVAAGALMKETARKGGGALLPTDSEHSAIFQILQGERLSSVERVILTASGGAFRNWTIDELRDATPEQAATHPNWAMGQRITIDSASMFNKALEVIEAKELFDISPDAIEVVIHPQSLIHAIVGFNDGALMAHLGPSDMRHAISYALNYPERRHIGLERLDLVKIAQLDFSEPDLEKYPALILANDVMRLGALSGSVFNAAKEAALSAFIEQRIGFLDMAQVVENVLEKLCYKNNDHKQIATLDNILWLDQTARNLANELIAKYHS